MGRIASIVLVALGIMACVCVGSAQASVILLADHMYDSHQGGMPAIDIKVEVDHLGGLYKWTYTVTNINYEPLPGASNGFSGFELDLPGGFPPDLANVTSPSAAWINNCCSGAPEEWDIMNSAGAGILPGEMGVFSFTTKPRTITNSTGWFHTWVGDSQFDVTNWGETPGAIGPEAPNLLVPPIPEPGTLTLLGSGLAAVVFLNRIRKTKR